MTRTEQIKLTRRAGWYITIADHCNDASFATLCIGVPLTLLAFMGYSIWPGIIFWAVSWCTYSLCSYYTAAARELHAIVNRAREEK